MSHCRQCAHNIVYVLFETGLLGLLISAAQRHFALQFLLLYGFSLGCGLRLGKEGGRWRRARRFRWDDGVNSLHFKVAQRM